MPQHNIFSIPHSPFTILNSQFTIHNSPFPIQPPIMQTFPLSHGSILTDKLISAIQGHKQYLSDIDGAIGDGDHGINMNKGFSMWKEALEKEPGDLSHSLLMLARILMMKIGGSMGPLYGKFFMAFAKALQGKEEIGKEDFLSGT
jgi:phosphoenolpyruvate---glycerone phosphotransferase subunit DhaL